MEKEIVNSIYTNPILPGFYPDPSICRYKDDYYLINSSFEFFPGVPLFHSRDLIHWDQIGHVLTRKSQIDLKGCPVSGGIWAPTLREYQGRFYMVVTNFSGGGNFYVWTDDIYGEWSEPIWVRQEGIDPSLFFDQDGTVYFSSKYEDSQIQGIGQCVIDIKTGEMLTETKVIWKGSGGKYPEGPHMYRRNDQYYLMIAEGGTEYGHMETIARSSSPWGPFEGCPRNPILTHRDTVLTEFQALGHADLVETPTGHTWMAFHGIRTSQYMLHHLGRETMIAPVTWDDEGWPLVNGGKLITSAMETDSLSSGTPGGLPTDASSGISEKKAAEYDDFDAPQFKNMWNFLRNPNPDYYSLAERPGSLMLNGSAVTLNDCDSPTFIGRRQQHFDFCAKTVLSGEWSDSESRVGITVFHTNEHHYDLSVLRQGEKRAVVLRKHVGDMQTESAPVWLPEEGKIRLCIEADRLEYRFWAGLEAGEMQPVGSGRTQLLSTECMPMTFTGCYIGLFAEGNVRAWFDFFEYVPESSNSIKDIL